MDGTNLINLFDENSNYWLYTDNYNHFSESYEEEPRLDINEENKSNDMNDINDNKPILNYNENLPKIFYDNNIDFKSIITGKTETEAETSLNKKRERNNLEDYKLQIQDEKNNDNIINIFDVNDDVKEIESNENQVNQIENQDLENTKIIINLEEKEVEMIGEEGIDDETQKHTKFDEDNIMRKIKTNIFKYIRCLLNNSLIDKTNKFYPLETELNENLKKELNEKLLDRSLKDIYENSKLNERHQDKPDANKNLIKKIFDEKTELETIKILSMTYRDILEQIRKKDSFNFLEEIRKKEKNKKKNTPQIINSYLEKLKKLLDNYEGWFNNKLGRNTEKRKKNKVKKI